MGLLRLILAIVVVISHSTPVFGLESIGGLMAVETFFIISGFYMALILSGKYKDYKTFLTNRILRIYPLYWLMVMIMLLAAVAIYFFVPSFHGLDWFHTTAPITVWVIIYLVVVHVILIGQDILLFTKYSDMLIVPQAWALSLEMIFYLLVPFIVKWKNWILVSLLVGSLGLRVALYQFGFTYNPWTYRFFPTELAFFIAGILSFRLYRYLGQTQNSVLPKFSKPVYWVVIVMTIFYQFIPTATVKHWGYYLLIALALPFVFSATKNSKKDRRLGDFSYPIYISHIFVLAFAKKVFVPFVHLDPINLGLITVVFTIAFSYILLKLVGDPIEKIRQRRSAAAAPLPIEKNML